MTERKEVALAALRTWRGVMNDRDRLVRAARDAGATLAEITDASGLAKGTVRTALDTPTDTEETMTTISTADPLAGHHHPHYLSGRVTRPGTTVSTASYEFTFRPFSGHEQDPEDLEPQYGDLPDDLPREAWFTLHAEYRAARIMWAKARFKIQVRPLLERALPLWLSYVSARTGVDAAFAAFTVTSNDQWNAQQLRLAQAHQELLEAAGRWDDIALLIERAQEEHLREAGEGYELTVSDVAPEFGMNTSDWLLGWDYIDGSRLATEAVNKLIDQQRERLAQIIH
ncbi:hypothetical protein DMB42_52095 [Nonomuraea sp. WAC 01424]|uniref:hypothetical protein n=1 Tax=Nonomuraea sp. WAC 01424 TaxID=2203200 RepID=UPI000F7B4212|nr:hypothetical protein [Nonomuraea sp. WAC 01424]RSM93775.1 hypothetical protein DMB42_52095 [Nonomuraea sp. WAC 01424]